MVDMLSPYIVAGVAAWTLAQGIKILLARLKKTGSWRNLYLSGGMPSAHSATVTAVLLVVGVTDGVQSALFGITLLFSAIVIYDAVKLRRSSGEQGNAIVALIKEQKSKVSLPRVALGHTPLEVLVGILLGIIVGIAIYFVFNT